MKKYSCYEVLILRFYINFLLVLISRIYFVLH